MPNHKTRSNMMYLQWIKGIVLHTFISHCIPKPLYDQKYMDTTPMLLSTVDAVTFLLTRKKYTSLSVICFTSWVCIFNTLTLSVCVWFETGTTMVSRGQYTGLSIFPVFMVACLLTLRVNSRAPGGSTLSSKSLLGWKLFFFNVMFIKRNKSWTQ